jgi:hypothetical protein
MTCNSALGWLAACQDMLKANLATVPGSNCHTSHLSLTKAWGLCVVDILEVMCPNTTKGANAIAALVARPRSRPARQLQLAGWVLNSYYAMRSSCTPNQALCRFDVMQMLVTTSGHDLT